MNHNFLVCFQSEINEVCEKFNMPPTTTEDCSISPSIRSDWIAVTTGQNNGVPTRSLSAVEGDNNLLPEAAALEEVEKVELRSSSAGDPLDNESATKTGRSSILPYPRGADCREDLVADWANSVMRECEELVIDVIDSRPTSLVVPEDLTKQKKQMMMGGSAEHSYADHVVERHPVTLMATRTPLSGAENSDASAADLRRIPKPDKLVRYSF